MRDTTTEIVYHSLGNLLKQISRSAAVQNSPETAETVRNAIAFHQELEKEVSALINENRNLKQERETALGLANITGCIEESVNLFRKYEQMKLSGATPQQVYRQIQSDKLDSLNTIKILRRVFDLSLSEATEILQTNGRTKNADYKGKRQHVVPLGNDWAVKGKDSQRVNSTHNTQAEAIEAAREIAIKQQSEVVIHRPDGRVRDGSSYGKDDSSPKELKSGKTTSSRISRRKI